MIIVIIVIIIIICFLFIYLKKTEPTMISLPPTIQTSERPEFIPSSTYIGSKPGYVFYRSDKDGLGYHLDKKF